MTPDYCDLDGPDLPVRYCPHCECNTVACWVDNGFDFEYGSQRGYHRQDDLECSICGCGRLEDERAEELEEESHVWI